MSRAPQEREWISPAPGASGMLADVRVVDAADTLTDADLVERARNGDRWAEETIYRRHVAHVSGVVTRLIGRHEDGADVMQETFAIALEQLGSLRDGMALRAWLTRIAVSRVRRRVQRLRLARLVGLDRGTDDATLESFASDQCSPEIRAELAAIGARLKTLPADVRIAWILRYVDGLSVDEVAEACGCSRATIKRRIAAAQQFLARELGGAISEGDGS